MVKIRTTLNIAILRRASGQPQKGLVGTKMGREALYFYNG